MGTTKSVDEPRGRTSVPGCEDLRGRSVGSNPCKVFARKVKHRHKGQVAHNAKAGTHQGAGAQVRTTVTSVWSTVTFVLMQSVVLTQFQDLLCVIEVLVLAK